LVRAITLLLVPEHAVHTCYARNLKKITSRMSRDDEPVQIETS